VDATNFRNALKERDTVLHTTGGKLVRCGSSGATCRNTVLHRPRPVRSTLSR
jgi:hypothetical protein